MLIPSKKLAALQFGDKIFATTLGMLNDLIDILTCCPHGMHAFRLLRGGTPLKAYATRKPLPPVTQSYDNISPLPQSPPGCHEPEPEPIPPSIDNWARGVVPCKHVSWVPGKPPSPRGDQEEEERALEGGEEQESSKMPVSNDHTGRRGSKNKVATSRGAKDVGDGNAARNRDDDDGRAWGDGTEEGEDIGLLCLFSEEGHGLGDEKLAGAGGIGDAIGRGRQHDERAFLEVCPSIRCPVSSLFRRSTLK